MYCASLLCIIVFLQTQYIFIHNAIQELITCGETEIAAANIRVVIGRLSRVTPGKLEFGFQVQLNVSTSQ